MKLLRLRVFFFSPHMFRSHPNSGPSDRYSYREHIFQETDRWYLGSNLEHIPAPTSHKDFSPNLYKNTQLVKNQISPPGTSLPGSWRDTCRFLRCLHGGRQGVFWHPLRRRHGVTPCEQTENEELGSGESPELQEPSSAPHETPRYQSGRDGNFPVGGQTGRNAVDVRSWQFYWQV